MSGRIRASFTVSMIFPGTRSSWFDARFGLIGSPSCDVRNADGQTFSPVFELISSVPRIPGMTITGRFPVLVRAAAKMASRLGVWRAEIHALVTRDVAMRIKIKRRECATADLFNGHRPATIDEARDEACAESVIDVHDSHIRRARVQHTEQRRDTSKRCAISDAGWHSHHRNAYEAADDGGQRAFHARRNDHDARALQQAALGEYAMNSSDAGVPDTIDDVPHRFRRECGFFGDGDIARAGCDDCDRAEALVGLVATNADEASGFVPFGVSDYVTNLAKCAFVSACDEDVWRTLGEAFDDADDLRARLAAAKNDFGKALSRRARVVNARETDVFEVKVFDAVGSLCGFEFAAFVRRQKLRQFVQIHRVQHEIGRA